MCYFIHHICVHTLRHLLFHFCFSYGFISNLNYGTALGAAWIAFVKKYGVAPTAPGQWQVFLAFYAGESLV
jgi:hypothetical protein